jgi:hypothetical protein
MSAVSETSKPAPVVVGALVLAVGASVVVVVDARWVAAGGSEVSGSVELSEQPIRAVAATSTAMSGANLERILAPFPPISTNNDTYVHTPVKRLLDRFQERSHTRP